MVLDLKITSPPTRLLSVDCMVFFCPVHNHTKIILWYYSEYSTMSSARPSNPFSDSMNSTHSTTSTATDTSTSSGKHVHEEQLLTQSGRAQWYVPSLLLHTIINNDIYLEQAKAWSSPCRSSPHQSHYGRFPDTRRHVKLLHQLHFFWVRPWVWWTFTAGASSTFGWPRVLTRQWLQSNLPVSVTGRVRVHQLLFSLLFSLSPTGINAILRSTNICAKTPGYLISKQNSSKQMLKPSVKLRKPWVPLGPFLMYGRS